MRYSRGWGKSRTTRSTNWTPQTLMQPPRIWCICKTPRSESVQDMTIHHWLWKHTCISVQQRLILLTSQNLMPSENLQSRSVEYRSELHERIAQFTMTTSSAYLNPKSFLHIIICLLLQRYGSSSACSNLHRMMSECPASSKFLKIL